MEMLDTTEEERLETAKKWWQENGRATIVGIVLGLVVIYGWNFWKSYQQGQAAQASTLYAELLTAVKATKNDTINTLAQNLQEQFPHSEYAAYSGLYQAQLKVQQHDLIAAKALLQKIATGSNQEIANIARIRLLRIMLANKEYEQGLQLISEIDQTTTASFAGNYDELVGDFYVALDRMGEARTAYQKAVDNGYNSPLLQLKINDLSAPERIETIK